MKSDPLKCGQCGGEEHTLRLLQDDDDQFVVGGNNFKNNCTLQAN